MQIHTTSEPEKNPTLAPTNTPSAAGNGNSILRVESAAGEGLDELFKAVMSPGDGQSRLPQPVPMRQRRLPPSFFRPPSAASSTNSVNHSRESSLDGGYQSGQTPGTTNGQGKVDNSVMGYTPNGLAIIHPRANSSPAALQPANVSVASVNGQAFSSTDISKATNGTAASTNGTHFRQMSYDLEQIRLPDGWEMSYTANGERYFLNHKEKTTTWEDPRKKIMESMLRQNSIGSTPIIQQAGGVPQPSPAAPSPHQPSPPALVVPEPDNFVDPSIVPLPEGWEQARTPNGNIYFISHVDQSTTWFHPSIPRNLQMKRVQQQQQSCSAQPPPFQSSSNIPPELVAALKNMNTSCQTPTTSTSIEEALKSQQSQHLRDLELERERMRQRQEEILQNSLLSSNASNLLLSSSTEQNQTSPFILQNECHSRQESADSGLDLGNSSNYSMPHTPDDFLRLGSNGAANTNGNGLTGSTLTGISEDISFENMQLSGLDLDSESMDFMQSLDMDLLSNVEELLNSNKDNIMTWL